MTNRFPLIVDSVSQTIKELPIGDNLDLTGSGINGGTIDGTVIGGSTPAAVTGTTITAAQYDSTEALPDIKPSLNLDFANVKKLDPRITYTRTSTGTYYEGVTFAKAEENLLLQSQDFTTTWGGNRATVTADADTAPDGTTTADSILQASGQTLSARLFQDVNVVAGDYFVSIYAKPNGKNFLLVRETALDGTSNDTWFNVSTGAVGTTDAGHTATITASTNSYYRCSVKLTANAARTGTLSFYVADSDGSLTVADDTNGLYLWGAQLEQRSALTDYTATTTQPITNYVPALQTAASGEARFDHDPLTGESLGFLIEEQRTNLVTYSEDFANAAWTKTRSSITSNIVVAPDGTLTGDKLVEDTTASNTHQIDATSITVVSGTTYAISVYMRAGERTKARLVYLASGSSVYADFDLSAGTAGAATAFNSATAVSSDIQDVGNGWYRCSVVGSQTAGTSGQHRIELLDASGNRTYTGDGYSGIYIWGAQLEAGAFPTSYIKTTSAQATRNADSASMTGTNFSEWYNQSEGSWYVSGVPAGIADSSSTPIFQVDAGSLNVGSLQRHSIILDGALSAEIFTRNASGASEQTRLVYDLNGPGEFSASFARDASTQATTSAGQTVQEESTIFLGPRSRLILGQAAFFTDFAIRLRKLAYYPKRLSNATLQALTEE